MYRDNLARTNLNNFSRLLKYKNDNNLLNEYLLKYVAHLNYLITKINEKFEDLIKLDIPSYIISPFIIENYEFISYSTDIQEELYDIKYYEELKIIFRK